MKKRKQKRIARAVSRWLAARVPTLTVTLGPPIEWLRWSPAQQAPVFVYTHRFGACGNTFGCHLCEAPAPFTITYGAPS